MADINQPDEDKVRSVAPDSLVDSNTALITMHTGLAGAYIYGKLKKKYEVPFTTAWTDLTNMWALLVASFILTPVFPRSQDDAEKSNYQRIVDAWLDEVTAEGATFEDDAGNELPRAISGSGACPESSTENIKPMFYRPTESIVTGGESELTQDTADTEIVEQTGKDNY